MYKLHNTKVVSVGLSVLTAVFAVSVIAYAATSIGTNLTVAGTATIGDTLGVTGATTFTGAITANGDGTFGNANTDIFLFTGRLQASTTALFTSGLTSYSNVIVTAGNSLGVGTTSPTASLTTKNDRYVAGTGFFGNTLTATSSAVLARDGGKVGVASSTPAQELGVVGDVFVGSGATSTVYLASSLTTAGGCIDMRSATGTQYKMYIGGADTVGATSTRQGRNGAFFALWEYGACQ